MDVNTTTVGKIDTCDNVHNMSIIIKNEFEDYKNQISSFFAGKESEIHSMYEAIRDNSFPYNTISVIDVNFAIHAYSDYLEGLIQFVNKVLSLKEEDSIDQTKIEETIHAIEDKDNLFITSIFGGEKNPNKAVNLDTAIKNIESIVDVNDDFAQFTELSNTLCLACDENVNDKYKTVMLEGLRTFFKSIHNYNQKCVENIFSTYEYITKSMEKRTPVHGEPVIPEYQMF